MNRMDGECLAQCDPDLDCMLGCTEDLVSLEVRVYAYDDYSEELGGQIDIGEDSGKIVFTASPNINPMKIIQLIQSDPKQYRFDGKQTLRIQCQSGELEDRFKQVEDLLKKLTAD